MVLIKGGRRIIIIIWKSWWLGQQNFDTQYSSYPWGSLGFFCHIYELSVEYVYCVYLQCIYCTVGYTLPNNKNNRHALRGSIYLERQGGREVESPLVMELLSTNDSSLQGFISYSPSYGNWERWSLCPLQKFPPFLMYVSEVRFITKQYLLPSSQEDYWCKNSKFAVSSDSLPIRSSTPFLSSLCHPPSSPPL